MSKKEEAIFQDVECPKCGAKPLVFLAGQYRENSDAFEGKQCAACEQPLSSEDIEKAMKKVIDSFTLNGR